MSLRLAGWVPPTRAKSSPATHNAGITERRVGPWRTTSPRSLCAILALVVTTLACGTNDHSRGPHFSNVLNFSERLTVAVDLREGSEGSAETDGGVVSILVDNEGPVPVVIDRMEPVADPGLRVSYIGYCARSCQGAGRWDPQVEAGVKSGLEGVYPVEVLPLNVLGRRHRLIFRLEAVGPGAIGVLREGCLVFRSAILTLEDGRRMRVAAFGGRSIAGLYGRAGALPGSKGCEEMFG